MQYSSKFIILFEYKLFEQTFNIPSHDFKGAPIYQQLKQQQLQQPKQQQQEQPLTTATF